MAFRRTSNGAENYSPEALQEFLDEGVPYNDALRQVTTTFDGLPPRGNVHSIITGCGDLNYDENLPQSRHQKKASQEAHQYAVSGITPEEFVTVKESLYQEFPNGIIPLRVNDRNIRIPIDQLDLTQEAHYDFVIERLYNL